MKTLTRLIGAVRGQIAELGDSIIGNQAQRALDDEIRDADTRMREWRASLAEFRVKQLAARERADAATAAIVQRETQAAAALLAGKPALARDVARAIAQLEQARDDEQAFLASLDACTAQLAQLIEQGESRVRRLRHQLDVLRAAETVQRAQETVAARQSGTPLPQTAVESLLRAQRQVSTPDCPAPAPAPVELGDAELDARLQAAGIGEHDARADLILERIGERLARHTGPRE